MPIGKNSKGEWVGGGRSHDHPPPLPPSATDAERQERGDPESRQGWMDRPTPTLAEAFEHVQRLAPEGDRESELALGIISVALRRGERAEADLETTRREIRGLFKRLEDLAEVRVTEAREAVRNIAAHGRDCRATGRAEATENAANWLDDGAWEALGGTERDVPPCLDGCDTDRPLLLLAKKLRAGEHLAQDPAKEPVR